MRNSNWVAACQGDRADSALASILAEFMARELRPCVSTFPRTERGKELCYAGGMSEVSIDQLKEAVESQHGGAATFVQAVPVHEVHNGETVWDGVVHVFNLKHCPSGAFRAYAWSYECDDGKRRFFAVLHTPQIDGPRKAVQAAIVAEARAK